MKHVKMYEDRLEDLRESNSSLIVENKFKNFMSSLGRHAISAIIGYFHENPDALKEVLGSMKSSGNKDVQRAFKEIR